MEEPRKFSEVLKEIRLNNGWSQEEMARHLGTSKQVISRYETEQRIPKVSIVREYAKKLNISFNYLFGYAMTAEDGARGDAALKALREKDAKTFTELMGLDADAIRFPTDDEEAITHKEQAEKMTLKKRRVHRLSYYISARLPDLDDSDVKEICEFVDQMVERKKLKLTKGER